MALKQTSLRKIMDITSAGIHVNKATATNSYISNSLNIEEFSENKVYEKGNRVYRGDTLNGNPIIYVCIERTSGFFDPVKWKKDGFLETINSYIEENNELINQRNSFQSHSGFLNKISPIKANKNGKNELYFTDNENINIGGNIIKIPKNTKIFLPEPPKTGSRDDLVIFEYWKADKDIGQPFFENGMYGGKVIGNASYQQTTFEWRIRSIPGVIFDNGKSQDYNLGEGLGRYSTVTAQGPKFTPVEDDGENGIVSRLWSVYDRNESSIKGKYSKYPNDRGVYIAGDGSKESITKLETSDGYIIAIPLLKIRRYNNEKFSTTNILGAPNRKSINLPPTDLELNDGVAYLNVEPISDISILEIGETYEDNNFLLKISEINNENNTVKIVVTVNSSSITYTNNHTGNVVLSDNYIIKTTNCFGRYADIIQDNDIIDDFRHIIYLGGTDYNYLRESAFDQFMRSETINTEYSWAQYGLEPVFEKYKDSQENLFPVTIVNKNGKTVKLKNLLGPKSIVTSENWPNKIRTLALETSTPMKLLIGLKVNSNNTSETKLVEIKPKTGSNTIFNINNKDGWNFFIFEIGVGYENIIDIVLGSADHTCKIIDGFLYEIDTDTYNSYKNIIDGGEVLSETILDTYPLTYSNYKTIKNYISDKYEKHKGFITDSMGVITGIGEKENSKIYKIKISNKLDDSWLKVLYSDDLTRIGFYTSLLDENTAPVSYIDESSTIETLNGFKVHRTLNDNTEINYMVIETAIDNNDISIVDINVPDDIRPIPSGYWHVPENFYNKNFEVRTNDWVNDVQRQIYSQSQVSQKVVDVISPVIGADSPFLTITQASNGIWSVGDKITISLIEGVVGGTDLIIKSNQMFEMNNTNNDSETGKTEIIDWIGYDDLESVGDKESDEGELESSAVPLVIAEGITGTWEGIGKNEAVFTLTEVTSSSVDIKIIYSANYPTGQGMQDMIHFPYAIEINKQSLRNLEHGPIITMNFKNVWYNSEAHNFIFDQSVMGKISHSTIESTGSVNTDLLDTSWGTEITGTYEKTYHSSVGLKTQMESQSADKRVVVKVMFNLEEYLRMKYCSSISDFTFNGMELELDISTIQPTANTINIYAVRNRTKEDPTDTQPIIEKVESNFVCDNIGIKKIFLNKHFITNKYVCLLFETTENSDGIVDQSITIKHLSVSLWITTRDLTPTITEPIVRWDYRLFKDGEQLLPPFDSNHWVSNYKEVAKNGNYQGPSIKLENFLFIEEPEEFTLSVKDFSNATIKVGYKNSLGDSSPTIIASIASGETSVSFIAKPYHVLNIYIEAIVSDQDISINDIILTKGKSTSFSNYKSNGLAFYEFNNFEMYEENKLEDGSLPEKNTNLKVIRDKSMLVNSKYSVENSVSFVGLNGKIKYYRISLKELGISYRELMLQNSTMNISFDYLGSVGSSGTNSLDLFIATKESDGNITWTNLQSLTIDSSGASVEKHADIKLNIGTKKNNLYFDEDLGFYIAFENQANRTNPTDSTYINLLNINFVLSLSQNICKYRTNSIKFGNILRANKAVFLSFTKKSFMSGVLDTISVFYTHKPTIPSEISGMKSLSIISESDGFLASDYGTCVGSLNIQHHYNSPLYRVNLDKDTALGEIGFMKIPFKAGHENINTGTNVTILENGDNVGFTPQKCENLTDKPLVGIASYLVNMGGEIRLAIARHYSPVGNVKVTGLDPKYIFPIKGRPLIKDIVTNNRELVSTPSDSSIENSSGEIIISGIKGYKNSKGYLITFYR